MSIELLNRLDELHTTPLGEVRIRRNLGLVDEDVVDWCRQRILSAEDIIRKGKNWYIYVSGIIITVNAYSLTIITAHPQKAIRKEI